MRTIYERFLTECSSNIIGHHASDLYVLKNSETTEIIKQQKASGEVLNITTFRDQETNRECYDIAFGYDPFWQKIINK